MAGTGRAVAISGTLAATDRARAAARQTPRCRTTAMGCTGPGGLAPARTP